MIQDTHTGQVPNAGPALAAYIRQLIAEDKLYRFYKSPAWLALRDQVLQENHYECAHCLQQGRYTRAVMVHHVNEVKQRPDMALTKTYTDQSGQERMNLVPLCFACHEAEHDRFASVRAAQQQNKFTNTERW